MHCRPLLSNRFLSLCSFLASHFSLCYSAWIISIDMYSELVSLLLSPCNEALFYFSYCIFKFKIAIWFLCISSVSLLKLSMFLFISSVLALASWSAFVTGALKSLSDNPSMGSSCDLCGFFFRTSWDFPGSSYDE